tara:strand:- start:6522 stop:7082 length:561 start_codon:yes stop_codon:yes gene_type:complete
VSKKCIFVGNAKFNKSYSDIIDSYEHVYRFNRFTTSGNFGDIVGKKCTHWIINNALSTDRRDLFRKNIKRYTKLYPELESVWVITNKKSSVSKLEEIKKQNKIFNFYISPQVVEGYKNTTGTLSINFFLKQYEEIHLVGFDFGKSNHYWVSGKVTNPSDKPGRHRWDLEKHYIMSLVDTGRVKIYE